MRALARAQGGTASGRHAGTRRRSRAPTSPGHRRAAAGPGADRVAGRGLIGRAPAPAGTGVVVGSSSSSSWRWPNGWNADDLALERLAQVRVRGFDLGEDRLELVADQLVPLDQRLGQVVERRLLLAEQPLGLLVQLIEQLVRAHRAPAIGGAPAPVGITSLVGPIASAPT